MQKTRSWKVREKNNSANYNEGKEKWSCKKKKMGLTMQKNTKSKIKKGERGHVI